MDITLNLCDICEVIYQFTLLSLCGAFYSHITLAYLLGMGFFRCNYFDSISKIKYSFHIITMNRLNMLILPFTFLSLVPTMALTNIYYGKGKCTIY